MNQPNKNPIKVPQSQRIINRYYETLWTSVINSSMSPPSLFECRSQESKEEIILSMKTYTYYIEIALLKHIYNIHTDKI